MVSIMFLLFLCMGKVYFTYFLKTILLYLVIVNYQYVFNMPNQILFTISTIPVCERCMI